LSETKLLAPRSRRRFSPLDGAEKLREPVQIGPDYSPQFSFRLGSYDNTFAFEDMGKKSRSAPAGLRRVEVCCCLMPGIHRPPALSLAWWLCDAGG